MTAAITIEGLTKRFGNFTAVDDLSLEVPQGSVFGFLGANGAGKTTTIRTIAGLTRPTRGRVEVGGITTDAGPAYRRQIGFLCQDPAFYGWMTGREVLRYAAGFYPESKAARAGEIERLLKLVGLADAADRPCGEYSGGMRQRLGIGAALVGRPTLLLLDEPATGLDPLGRKDVLELMEELRSQTTIFYSTHILDDVQRVSDRVAVVDHGKLLVTDTTENLLTSYTRNRIRVELIGANPETTLRLAGVPGVAGVTVAERRNDSVTYTLKYSGEEPLPVQAAVTRLAASDGLVVVEARPEVMDLEQVFLRLVGKQEIAA